MNIPPSDERCPVRRTLSVLGRKWSFVVIFQVGEHGRRYGDLRRAIPGISEKVLLDELSHLVEHGLLDRHYFAEAPPRVEYTLTDKGRQTVPIMNAIAQFGLANIPA